MERWQAVKLAQVIVDVPTRQTDAPYTYLVPKSLRKIVAVGMRVVVPFGSRKVQGFVVSPAPEKHRQFRLKPISSLMDLTPVVNQELLKLSKWLAQATFSFRINCLITMLPGVMKAKYDKQFLLTKPVKRPELKSILGNRRVWPGDSAKLTSDQIRALASLKRKRLVKTIYLVKNQAHSAKVKLFKNQLPVQQIKSDLKQIPSKNVSQIALLKFMKQHPNRAHRTSWAIQQTPHLRLSTIEAAENRKWVKIFKVKRFRDPYHRKFKRNYPLKLNRDQSKAVSQISLSLRRHQFAVYLLEGVTGSGKTEVYLQVISQALQLGRTALMLVPEIALTPQMVNWVRGRFGNRVAILHSGLSAGEKYDEWQRINNHQAEVVVGVRSAIFAPLTNIGVIIMDEEHDSSYKQESVPRYQTRRVAKWRGRYHRCPVILGSATPSLESRARATKRVYHLLRLPHRVNHQPLPVVHVVDMRKEIIHRHETNYSLGLVNAIKRRIHRHEQVVLMLNRRGYSNFLMCRTCGYVPKCPNCDISLTWHYRSQTLKCHYCGYEEPLPQVCPRCHSRKIRGYGTGTEKAEMELKRLIPEARVIRMDVDTTSRKGAHARLLHRFGAGEANVLLGTQMIAKGLDFPNVTLVGVINADTSLELPDFRSAERTFQLLTQVSGRAGRAEKKGEVFIQTFNPDNYAIRLAQTQNYERFYLVEMNRRHSLGDPPYYFTVRVEASSVRRGTAAEGIYSVKRYLQSALSNQTIILGPAPSAISRIKRRYYYQIVLKYKHEPNLHSALSHVLDHYQSSTRRGLLISIDPDPVNFM